MVKFFMFDDFCYENLSVFFFFWYFKCGFSYNYQVIICLLYLGQEEVDWLFGWEFY